jgi:ABC-type multidrug transport system fused ATPase/permease subunit
MKHFLRILRLTGRSNRVLMLALLLASLSTAISVYAGVGLGQLAEKLLLVTQHGAPKGDLVRVFLYITAAYLGFPILGYIHDRVMIKFRIESLFNLRSNTYDFINLLPVQFFENNKPGSINQRATNACTAALNWIGDLFENNIFVILMPLFSSVTLFFYSWKIGMVAAIGLLLLGCLQVKKVKKREPHQRKANLIAEGITGFYTEVLDHMTTIRTTIEQSYIHKKLKAEMLKQSTARRNQLRVENNYLTFLYIVEGLVIMSAIATTVLLQLDGKIGIAGLVAVIGLIRASVGSTRDVGGLYSTFHTAKVEAERFTSLLDENADHLHIPDTQKQLSKIKSIEFKDVNFTYPYTSTEVLNGISFVVSDGAKLALVGESGSGKSTISKLILRLYEPTSGQILINGEDISVFTPQSIRRCIGSVMQDVALFHTTIKENIQMAMPAATEKDIKSALRVAHAGFVSASEKGIHTVIGERGVKLSGGQRQRIAIARAAVKQPNFILLDEATSALDSNTEKEVQAGLNDLMRGKSSVVIAHRLSTISDADQILVLSGGKVIEKGTHKQLLSKPKGAYAELWSTQSIY